MSLTVQGDEVPQLQYEALLLYRALGIVVVAHREDELLPLTIGDVFLEVEHLMVNLELRLNFHLFHEVEVLLGVQGHVASGVHDLVDAQEEEEVVEVHHAIHLDVFETFARGAVGRRLFARG